MPKNHRLWNLSTQKQIEIACGVLNEMNYISHSGESLGVTGSTSEGWDRELSDIQNQRTALLKHLSNSIAKIFESATKVYSPNPETEDEVEDEIVTPDPVFGQALLSLMESTQTVISCLAKNTIAEFATLLVEAIDLVAFKRLFSGLSSQVELTSFESMKICFDARGLISTFRTIKHFEKLHLFVVFDS